MLKILADYLTDFQINRQEYYHALTANNIQDAKLDNDGYYVSNLSGLDTPKFWEKIKENPDQYQNWVNSGWLKSDGSVKEIKYRINNSGFRGAHFTSDPALVFFGCSFTFGIGMHEEKIWPTRTSKHFNLQCCNLGIPGHGLDFYSLYVPLWLLNEIPTPKAFVIKFPPQPRVTVYRETNNNLYIENLLTSIIDAEVYKNPLMRLLTVSAMPTSKVNTFIALNAITSLAEQLNIPVIKIDDDHSININNSVARDYFHPGADTHAILSAQAIRKLTAVL